jgi:hypothetical protein
LLDLTLIAASAIDWQGCGYVGPDMYTWILKEQSGLSTMLDILQHHRCMVR